MMALRAYDDAMPLGAQLMAAQRHHWRASAVISAAGAFMGAPGAAGAIIRR
jgi:hypothetical protein